MEIRLDVNGIFCITALFLFKNGMSDDEYCDAIGRDTIGYTTPKADIDVLPGGDLVINCTLKPPHHNSENLFWKLLDKEVNASFVSVLDNRTAQLHLPNSQFPQTQFMAHCLTRNDQIARRNNMVCNNMVSVIDMPASNETMSCTSHEFINIFCRWTLPIEPNRDRSKWTLDFRNNYESLNCTCDEKTCLKWKCNYGGCQSVRMIEFSLKGENKFGNWTYNYTFDLFQNTILSRPVGLKYNEVGNTTAIITWDPHEECIKQILNSKYNTTQIEFNAIITRNNKTQDSRTLRNLDQFYNLTDLIPFANYNVEIRLRLVSDGFANAYGPGSHVNFKTLPGVPTMPPDNLIGTTLSDATENYTYTHLTVYWKAVPREFQGGEVFEYVISLSSDDLSTKIQKRTASVSVTYLELHKDVVYTIEVRGVNEIGESKEASQFFVSNTYYDFKGLEIDDVILDDNEAKWKYTVSWKILSNDVGTLVHYWCLGNKSENGMVHCNSSGINSMEVESDSVTHNFDRPSNPERYFFGVATKVSSKPSRLIWSSCTIPMSKPPRSPGNLKSLKVSATWVHLSWDPLSCDDKAVGIQGYQLHVVTMNDEDSNDAYYNVTGANVTQYNVSRLSPGVLYSFAIRTKTLFAVSDETSPLAIRTSSPEGAGGIVGFIMIPVGIFIVLLAAIGWWKYRRFQVKVTKMVHIELPKNLTAAPSTPPSEYQLRTGSETAEAPFSIDTNNSDNITISVNHLSQTEPENSDYARVDTNQEDISRANSTNSLLNEHQADDYTRVIRLSLTDFTTMEWPDEQQFQIDDSVDGRGIDTATRSDYVKASILCDISPSSDVNRQQLRDSGDDEHASEVSQHVSLQESDYHRLNSDFSVGRTKTSTAADQPNYPIIPSDRRRLNSGHSVSYAKASVVIHQPSNPCIPSTRRQLDSGYSVGYTKASMAMQQPDKSPAIYKRSRLSSSCSVGYTKASIAMQPREALSIPTDRQRLDSGCSVGYTKASSAMDQPVDLT